MKKERIKAADRILNLDKYIFAELDEWKEEARAKGADLIDLGIGNPDGATPLPVVEAAIKSIQNPKSHGYPNFRGKKEFLEAIQKWLKKRYDVDFREDFSIQTLSGAKEGLAAIAMSFTNVGDINITHDPYYPVLSRGTWVAGGELFHVPLREENDFLPDLDEIPVEIAEKAKIMFMNFPNNPTAAIATREFMEKVVKFCLEYKILLVWDLAYAEICFDGYKPLSIFSIKGAEDCAIEVHTFSKSFNMAGWRVGFVYGKREFVDVIHAMKTNTDYGTSTIVQDAAIEALSMDTGYVEKIAEKYARRRDFMVEALNKLGWKLKKPHATMYLWLKVPQGYKSKEYCRMVMDKTGVVFTPGIAFGKMSDDRFRVSLVQPDEKLKEAIERLEKFGIRGMAEPQ